MLNLFRKHARSWLIKVALLLIAVVFVFWGGYSYKTRRDLQVAQVDDHYISTAEYDRSYMQLMEMYRRQMGNAFSEDMIRQLNLKKQALDMMINRYLLTKGARELGLTASTEEIQEKILEYPVFQADNKFDHKRYVLVLQQNRLSPDAFEQQIADELTARKLEEFIKRRALVTEDDVRAEYQYNYRTVQLGYVPFEPRSFEDQVTVDDNVLQTYYEGHQDKYKDPEKRRVSYVVFKTDDYLGKVNVTEDDIRQYYEDNKDKYHHEAEVKARHILFSVKEDAPEAEVGRVEAEARKVLDEARKGADFAELAKKYSKDPGSAPNGGDLGFFPADRMEPAFSEKAFSMKPTEISDLVRTAHGFHIIKVEDLHPERTSPLEEVHNEIELSLKRDRARDIVYAKAREFADVAFAQKDIAKAAQGQNLSLTGAEVWVSQKDPLPGLDSPSPELMRKIFGLSEKELSSLLDVPQGLMVAQLLAVQAPQVLPLEQVKDRVTKDAKRDQGRVLAQQKASELLENARKVKSLDEAAKGMKLEMKKSEWFSRKEPDKNFRLSGEALNTVFQLEEAQPFPSTPLDVGPRIAVCQLLGKKTSDENLDKERAAITKGILDQKQATLWQAWMEEQRSKARIEVFRDL